jgi:hypothetical protein
MGCKDKNNRYKVVRYELKICKAAENAFLLVPNFPIFVGD